MSPRFYRRRWMRYVLLRRAILLVLIPLSLVSNIVWGAVYGIEIAVTDIRRAW